MKYGGKAKGRHYDFKAILRKKLPPQGTCRETGPPAVIGFWQAVADSTAWLGPKFECLAPQISSNFQDGKRRK